MVQDEKTRPRHIIDNGSSSRGSSNKKRSPDKSDKGLPPTRQDTAQVNYRIKAGLARLNSAVLAKAAKDLCDSNQVSVEKVLDWTNTGMFREVCKIAGFDHEKTASRMKFIADMPLRVRRDLIHSKIHNSIPGQSGDIKDGRGGEAE